jgi:hypothetical protein
MALSRIVDDAVRYSILRVAGRNDGAIQYREFWCR